MCFYVGTYNALKPALFIRDPELIRQITVKDFSHFHDRRKAPKVGGRLIYSVDALEGEEWKDVRNKLLPSFSAGKIKKMYGLIEECAELLVDQHFRKKLKIIFSRPFFRFLQLLCLEELSIVKILRKVPIIEGFDTFHH